MIAACPQRRINSGLEITYHVVGGCPSASVIQMLMAQYAEITSFLAEWRFCFGDVNGFDAM